MKRFSLAALSAAFLAIAPSAAASPTQTQRVCSGLTDACQTVTIKPGEALQSPRGRIPDVSSYQGHPNWAAAKAAGIAGAIEKGGEKGIDPDVLWNNAQLTRLHIWHAMYWFVRNTGCRHEASQITSLAHLLGVYVVINDLEVREAAGYGACLVPLEKAAGLYPIDYTAPGTFPGGGFGLVPLMQAEYGPTLHPFWRPVLAWQCTDGAHGCVTFVPGVGVDDVSINLGITRIVRPPARIHCFGPHAQLHNKTCQRIRPLVARWSSARDASIRALVGHGCATALPKARDFRTLDRYLIGVRRKPAVCATLHQRAAWFEEHVEANLY